MSCCLPVCLDPVPVPSLRRTAGANATTDSPWVRVPAGEFRMGTDGDEGYPEDGEGPVRRVRLDAFCIGRTPVTNREFREFVRATRYITQAEELGSSFVFYLQVHSALRTRLRPVSQELPWWLSVDGACWQRPSGPGSAITDLLDHPVVHISWHDAMAYCAWKGACLPSEAQWEYAARAGHDQRRFPWGDELHPGGRVMSHVWQGEFPAVPAPGWQPGTIPVGTYPPNDWGLYDMVGQVWEWCADTFSAYHLLRTGSDNPLMTGPGPKKSLRGGSFLCHESYCNRYRLAARGSNTPASSSSNTGFRVVIPAQQSA